MVGPQRYGSESRVPLGDNFPHCGFYPCVHRSSVRGTWLLRVELVLVGSRACGSTVPSLPSPTRPRSRLSPTPPHFFSLSFAEVKRRLLPLRAVTCPVRHKGSMGFQGMGVYG
ncbi:hypothetical protein QYE76_036343 [Lolium multiflorum]|uniref:Uncharacterized protein n=1 Tax=Lolium multiflorum TaxID=4521 RepID=A0AAD8R289_LOLMU|nr:hypothetical protein QYE76_036343 [Lolium multiflorum]